MILIGLGGNLPGESGSVTATLRAALEEIAAAGLVIKNVSPFYRSAPVPMSDQPWFVNAVAEISGRLSPAGILDVLLETEKKFGRVRGEKNAARILDLDLLDYEGRVMRHERLVLPHALMHERAFVLLPLRDLAPAWKHPVTGDGIDALIARLPEQAIERTGEKNPA
jgi:2-amino-4-hydroxy-6-hydroxymethyldihydropteridine diphosphokinase